METAVENRTAFFGNTALKKVFMDRIEGHRKADELIHGVGWKDGKGCAIGCLFHRYDHAYGEQQCGVPQSILRLIDGLFESLPNGTAKAWPERCFAAINPGADLSLVTAKWFVWMLADETDGAVRFAKTAKQRAVIESVAALYTRQANGEDVPILEFRKAADYAADYAAYAAYAAAYAAAYGAAAYAAYAADTAAADTTAAARSQARAKQADKLIELLKAA